MELGPNIQTVTTWYLYSSPNLGMTLDVSQDFEPFFQVNQKKTEWMSGSDRFTESPKAEQGTPPHPKPTHPTSAKESERLRPEGDVFTSWRLKMAGKSSLKTGPLWLHDSDLRLIWTNQKRPQKVFALTNPFSLLWTDRDWDPKKDLKSMDQNQKNRNQRGESEMLQGFLVQDSNSWDKDQSASNSFNQPQMAISSVQIFLES